MKRLMCLVTGWYNWLAGRKPVLPGIMQACKDWGVGEPEPVRYPHWAFDMEYEEIQRPSETKVFDVPPNPVGSPIILYCLEDSLRFSK